MMAIVSENAPADAVQVIAQSLSAMTRVTRNLPGTKPDLINALGGRTTRGPLLGVAAPHAVYEMTLEDVVLGRTLDQAKLVSWRYLVTRTGAVEGAAEVLPDMQTRFAGLNTGRWVETTVATLSRLETLDLVQQTDVAVRLLRIPSLSVVALWLKAPAQIPDVLAPLAPAPKGLVAGQDYTPAALLAALQPYAVERSNFDNRPKQKP
jgi:hypothetical protein